MSPEPSSLLVSLAATLATAVAIKLMDDLLDGEELTISGLTTAGATVYAMAALAVGVALAPLVALPLFAAAYAVGMLHEPAEALPSGMPAWLESVLAVAVAAVMAGTGRAIQALLVMLAVQLVDDLVDYVADTATPSRSLAHRAGRGEAALLAMICLALASAFGTILPLTSAAAYIVVGLIEPRVMRRPVQCRS